jgi:[ribosomal protein S5]-alanine N-acetyltransferase
MKTSRATKSNLKRVFLREPEPDDFDSLNSLYRASRAHFHGVTSSDFDRERFDILLAEAAKDTNAFFLVCRTDDREIVGSLNFSQIFRKAFQNAYLGYQLFAGYTGSGYMTEAVELGLHHAFLELELHRVEANVQPSNKPSIAVLQRNGFVKEGFSRRYLKIHGRWRDHERWAILKEDWLAKR